MKNIIYLLLSVTLGSSMVCSAQVSGRVYPERNDDLAWENDLVAFRVYGPRTQMNGERSFGYDLFLKYPENGPVLERLYAQQCSPSNWTKVDSLRKIDPVKAKEFEHSFTYHIDHGLGMDCFAVGPTLGCGVASLVEGDSILYPWCYRMVEIIENGPDRFKASLTFAPRKIGEDDSVVEKRVIILDRGSHLNKCIVSYEGLSKPQKIAVGFPIRMKGTQYCDVPHGIIAITDPTQGPDNGKIFLGAVCRNQIEEARIIDGHWTLTSTLAPEGKFEYYWGFAWDHADISSYDDWISYLQTFTE